ncbi:STAS-like domain-containing protein [Arcobacter sp. YIC-310]|uniref:STAS-like domain-containing protein n=1 Tax=Arcobacter sp. YIC-310 TaxID=3376632 RepID=UPI003C269CC2
MKTIFMKEFAPLNSHQVGIKIQNKIIENIEKSDEVIILDFNDVNICTDSFSQQLTTILATKITYKTLKERVKFRNLNDFLKELIKANLIKASRI